MLHFKTGRVSVDNQQYNPGLSLVLSCIMMLSWCEPLRGKCTHAPCLFSLKKDIFLLL